MAPDGTATPRRAQPIELEYLRAVEGTLSEGASHADEMDLLVELEPAHVPGLPGIAGMGLDLSGMLGGRRIDLRTAPVQDAR